MTDRVRPELPLKPGVPVVVTLRFVKREDGLIDIELDNSDGVRVDEVAVLLDFTLEKMLASEHADM